MDAGVLSTGHPYILMEHLRGKALAAVLAEQGRLPVVKAVDFILTGAHPFTGHSLS
jgi:hypothetical protein